MGRIGAMCKTYAGGVRIAPMSLYKVLEEVPSVRRFQLVQRAPAALELRVVAEDRERGFADATRALQSFLKSKGLSSVEIRRSDLLPRPDPVSGKFKHIYREME